MAQRTRKGLEKVTKVSARGTTVTRREVEGRTMPTYALWTKQYGPIAFATKDYLSGALTPWSWTLADGITWRYGDDHTKTAGGTRTLAEAAATVQARLDAYGIKEK